MGIRKYLPPTDVQGVGRRRRECGREARSRRVTDAIRIRASRRVSTRESRLAVSIVFDASAESGCRHAASGYACGAGVRGDGVGA